MGAKVPAEADPPKATTRLGDWYVTSLVMDRRQLVLAVSGVTLLPVVLPAAPFRTIPARVADGVEEMLHALGVDEAKSASERSAMAECVVGATNDRRVLGSMNDFIRMLPAYLGGRSLLDASLRLADAPCGPIAMESPGRATLALFERPVLRLVKTFTPPRERTGKPAESTAPPVPVRLVSRPATPGDAADIALIYNEGIEDRVATFETDLRTAGDVAQWFERPHPVVVVEHAGRVVAFAVCSPASPRRCYARNAEFSVYVRRSSRGQGAGRAAMTGLIEAARARGLTKFLSGVFPENAASRALLGSLGFREVGTYQRHGQLDGVWRDVVIVEKVL